MSTPMLIADSPGKKSLPGLVLIFLALVAGIVVAGISYQSAQTAQVRSKVERELSAIATLKVNELAVWRAERLSDARFLQRDETLATLARDCIAQPAAANRQAALSASLLPLLANHDYTALLFDARGRVCLATPATQAPPAAALRAAVADAQQSGEVTFLDFYRNETSREIFLALLVPIPGTGIAARPAGVLVIQIDPHPYLFATLQHWPLPSTTAEMLLVRRDGDEAVVLNGSRSRPADALTVRLPLTRSDVLAVRAARGQEGMAEGLDYRAEPVVAALRKIPGSPWSLVAHIDTAEAYAAAETQFHESLLIVVSLILCVGTAMGLWWRNQFARHYREKYLTIEAQRESEERYRSLVESSMDAVLLTAPDGRILSANATACRMFGATEAELISGGRAGIVDETDPRLQAALAERKQTGHFRGELTMVRRDGTKFPAEVSSAVFSTSTGEACTSMVIHDITHRQRSEATLRLQSAALTSAANGIVITDRHGIIVWVNPAFTQLTGYTFDEAFGKNPRDLVKSGEQQPAFYEQLWATIIDGHTWRGDLVNRRKDGSLYSEEQTITPVRDATGEITHFIGIKQDLSERQQAAAALGASERKFQSVFEQAAVGVVIAEGPRGQFVNVNRRFCEMVGYSAEELLQLSSQDLTHPDDLASDSATLEQLLNGSLREYTREKRYQKKDGSYIWVRSYVAPLDQTEARPRFRIGVFEDISERKAAEDELRTNEARFIRQRDALIQLTGPNGDTPQDLAITLRQITATSARTLCTPRVSIWAYNADRTALRCLDLYELAPDRHTSGLEISAADYPAYFRTLQQMDVIAVDDPLHDPRTCEFAESHLRPHGVTSILDASIHVHGLIDGVLRHEQIGMPRAWKPDEHTFAAALANLVSLALVEVQRRAAEQALGESELNYRTLADGGQVLIWTSGPDKKCNYFNQPWLAFTGRALEQELGDGWVEAMHPEDRGRCFEIYNAAIDRRERFSVHYRLRRHDGEFRWIQDDGTPRYDRQGNFVGYIGHCLDITDRKRAEDDLRNRNALIEAILAKAPIGFAVNTIHDGRAVFVSRNFETIYGVAPDSIHSVAEYFNQVYPDPVFREAMRARVTTDIATGDAARMRWDAIPITTHTGEHRVVNASNIPLPDQDMMISTVQDVTERWRAETELRASEGRYRLLFENNPLPMWLYEITTLRFLAVNESAVRHYGYSREEFLAMTINQIRPEDDVAALREFVEALQKKELSSSEWRHRRKDGSIIHVEIISRPLVFEGVDARLVLAADVTEKKLLEEKFLHAQRLESLGMLAAGIAHDLNNVLAPIVFAAPMLRDSLSTPRDLKILATLESSAARGSGLVKQILGFAHSTTGDLQPVQVKHLARDVVDMIEETFPKSIRLEQQIPSDLWIVRGNATQIHQVLLNLSVNARDAMPDGGTLRIAAANRRLDAEQAQALPGARPGAWLVIEIGDSGTGITPEVLAHIWDPFFTTKGAGKGTGLGLSTVRGIVASHRGFIALDTKPGHGSTFRVFFPALEEKPAAHGGAADSATPGGHGELLLVVDDDDAVRDALTTILAKQGYRTLSASDGVEAISHFTTHSIEIALVITDVDMPHIGGGALARILNLQSPGLPLLVISGLPSKEGDASEVAAARKLAQAFLLKPFSHETLLATVHTLLHPTAKA